MARLCLAVVLLAATASTGGAAAQAPLRVDSLTVEGLQVLRHHVASPLVALRLSSPVPAHAPAGVVELLQELARPEARDEVERLGATLELRREGDHAVIAVSGPASSFDGLVRVLRRATAEPPLAVAPLRTARAHAEDRLLGPLDRPAHRLRALLRHQLGHGSPPGSVAGLALEPEELRRWSGRIFHPAAARLVVVGPVPEPAIRAALAGWGGRPVPAPDAPAAAVPSPPADLATTPIHRLWAGIASPVRAEPAALAVAAEMVQRRVRASHLRDTAAEAWPAPGGGVLVLLGATSRADRTPLAAAAAAPLPGHPQSPAMWAGGGAEPTAAALGAYLRRMIAEAAALAGPVALEEARRDVRARLLLEARSPAGRADVIGRLADLLGTPYAAERLLARLDSVPLRAVHNVLGDALAQVPALATVRQ